MQSIYMRVRLRGGVAATHELLRDGFTSRQLTAAVRTGEIVRVRQGHYCLPELDPFEVEAVRVGGRLTGLAGARRHGFWTPRTVALGVAVHPDARALRTRNNMRRRLLYSSTDVEVSWSDARTPGTRSLMSAIECLREIARRESPMVIFAAAESALNGTYIIRSQWRRLVASLPTALRNALRHVTNVSQSGGESMFSFRMRAAGISFRQQVRIPGMGIVDFVLGDRLVIEIDGWEFHSSRKDFEEDRRRDAELSRLGYRVLRFSYLQVEQWLFVQAAVEAALARGDHRA